MKNKKHTSRNLEDHIDAKATVIDDAGTIDKEHKGVEWEATQGEVHSSTNLEDDTGTGKAVVLRLFTFAANPQAFMQHTPTKQELFSAHKDQIVQNLYAEDLKVFEEVEPKIQIAKDKKSYRIIVAGLPWGMNRAHIPTLSQIANGHS